MHVNCISEFLENPPQPMSLRLSSNLMVGVTRIYGQQWVTFSTDVNNTLNNLTVVKKTQSVDMPQGKVPADAITLKKGESLVLEENVSHHRSHIICSRNQF